MVKGRRKITFHLNNYVLESHIIKSQKILRQGNKDFFWYNFSLFGPKKIIDALHSVPELRSSRFL